MAEAVAAVLRDLGGADVVVAHSLGAAATTAALAGYPGLDSDLEVGALAFLSAPSDVTDFAHRFSHVTGLSMPVVHEMRRRIERRFGIEWQELNMARLAPRVSRPLWLAHSVDDREVPARHSRETAEAWPGAVYYETEGLGHHRILRDGPTIRRLVAFVTEHGRRTQETPRVAASAPLTSQATPRFSAYEAFDAAVTGYELS
jgi:pimeloyl-ACP methyl ester carboxylesterase